MSRPTWVRAGSSAEHAGLVGVLVLTFVEPTRTFLVPGDDPALRWVVLFVPYLFAFAWMALQPRRWRHLAQRPGGWLLLTAVWLLAISPWGLTPAVDLALAFGFLALAGLGVGLGGSGQWPMVRSALFWSLSITLAWSIPAVVAGAVNIEGRWAGVFGEANGLGFAAALAIIVGIDRWGRHQPGGLLLAALAVPVLILTDSRTSMLAALLGVAIWARPLIGRWAIPAAVALVAVGVVGSIATESLGGAAELVSRSGEAEEVATFTGRTWVWSAGIEELRARPIVGFGAGSTTLVYEKVRAAKPDEGFDVGTAHNLWLQLALNGGVVAAGLVFIAFVQYACTAGVRPVRDRDAIMAAFFVHGMTEDVVREPKAALVIIAAAIASVSAGSAVARTTTGRRTNHFDRPLQQHALARRSMRRQAQPGQHREARIDR